MTLVAGMSFGGCPAFIGDLLTSWGLKSEVTIPTQKSSGVFKGADGYFASGLAQKISIVRPYLIVAYAGSMVDAKKIISLLDEALPLSSDEVAGKEDLFLSVIDQTPETLELVALYFDGKQIWPFLAHTHAFEIAGRRLYILGSGTETFFNFAQNEPDSILPHEDTKGHMVRATMLRFAANAMMFQWKTGLGLEESWGGGFEVAYTHDEGFKKVDDVLYRAWSIGDDDRLEGNIGVSFLHHYEGGDLHLTAFAEDTQGTTVVPSLVPSSKSAPSRSKVFPKWTVDLFLCRRRKRFMTVIQYQLPWSSNYHAEFHFDSGELVGWSMDKDRVNKAIEKLLTATDEGGEFTLSTI